MLTGIISVRDLVLALIGTNGDWRASLWYEQTNYMLAEPNPPRWALFVGEYAADSLGFVHGTAITIWQQDGTGEVPVRPSAQLTEPGAKNLYGAIPVRELVSRLLDVRDADAKLIMTGGYPLHLRVGKISHEGTPYAYLAASEAAVWTN